MKLIFHNSKNVLISDKDTLSENVTEFMVDM